jgi:hypothetical protein
VIKKPDNYDNVVVNRPFEVGGYVLEIVKTEYVPTKEYVMLYVDIAEGPFKGYFAKKQFNGNWSKDAIKYLPLKNTEGAIKVFKGDMTAIENSNPNYIWDWEEKSLVGKRVGGVFGKEQYEALDGTPKFRIVLKQFRSVNKILSGDFTVPETKYLEIKETTPTKDYLSDAKAIASFVAKPTVVDDFDISDDDLPF